MQHDSSIPLDDDDSEPFLNAEEFENNELPKPPVDKTKQRIFGLLVILGIVLSWVGSGEFANYVGQYMQFKNYFFIVYVLDVWNILIFPLFSIYTLIYGCCTGTSKNPIKKIQEDMERDNISFMKICLTALVSTFNQVIADYGYFRAISITSASSGIVIFNLSSIFAYVLSLLILPDEKFSWVKLISVAMAFGGAAAITFSDKENSFQPEGAPEPWIGDVTMAVAAIFWALFLTIYKRFVGEPSFGTINLQGTLMGVFSTLLLWPILVILHYTNVEPFVFPTGLMLGLIMATTGMAFINNYLFTFGTAITSPVFVTIGGMLAIPVSAVVDWAFHHHSMNVWKILGTIVMAFAFIIINVDITGSEIIDKFKSCCNKDTDNDGEVVLSYNQFDEDKKK